MAETDDSHDVTCPHCRRQFTGELIGSGRRQGYKCPHCRLFVPVERAAGEQPASR